VIEQLSFFDPPVIRQLTLYPRPNGKEDPFSGHCPCGWSSGKHKHPDDVAAVFELHRHREAG
jgi:hypothetical protein